MYWPTGTPSIFATSSSSGPDFNLVISEDGLAGAFDRPSPHEPNPHDGPLLEAPVRSSAHDDLDPVTPNTPLTPAVKSVEKYESAPPTSSIPPSTERPPAKVPLKDPVLALRMSRNGHIFAVITATSMTVWQTKVGNYSTEIHS